MRLARSAWAATTKDKIYMFKMFEWFACPNGSVDAESFTVSSEIFKDHLYTYKKFFRKKKARDIWCF